MTTIETYAAAARERGVPGHCIEGMAAYCAFRRPTGSFLRAVFENDLCGAIGHADEINQTGAALRAYATFLRWDAPPDCWGSKAKVQAWLKPTEEKP